MQALIQEAKVK